MDSDDRVRRLTKMSKRHVLPVWGTTIERILTGRGQDYIGAQGTVSLFRYGEHCIGVTCQHVLDGILNRSEELWTSVPVDRKLDNEVIFRGADNAYNLDVDLAIIQFDIYSILLADKVPIDITDNSSKTILNRDILLAAGYPGYLRKPRVGGREHGLLHFFSTVRKWDDEFIIMEDKFPRIKDVYDFGGMSGGPVFKLGWMGDYSFAGIIVAGVDNSPRFQPNKKNRLQIIAVPVSVIMDIFQRIFG